jgi:DNA-binding SARP family transcriptional activator
MVSCRLLLLGPPQLQSHGSVVPVRLRKAVALVAYLAVEQRAFSRDYLAALLWPNHGQKSALANLRRTLFQVKAMLGEPCVVTEGDLLRLDKSLVTVDVDEFRDLLALGSGDTGFARLEDAADLYRGVFLEGFNLGDCLEFDEWQDSVRERFAVEFDALLERLVGERVKANAHREALPFALRWLELDHTNEGAHRALMEIYARTRRPDLAHRQFETCVRILARQGMETDVATRTLHDSILAHRIEPETPSAGDVALDDHDSGLSSEDQMEVATPGRGRRRRRHIELVIGAVVVVVAMGVLLYGFRVRIFGCDLSATALETIRRGNEVAGFETTIRNEGVGVQDLDYEVVFTSDGSIGIYRDYTVYAGRTTIGRNETQRLQIGIGNDICEYVERNGVDVPPGAYTATVVLDSAGLVGERSELNNQASVAESFFYPGSPGAQSLDVEILYSGVMPFDRDHPLRVTIGDRVESRQPQYSAEFTVHAEARYYFAITELPREDDDGSGYFMMIEYDVGNNRQTDRGDVAALYKVTSTAESAGNLVYGAFSVAAGTPMFPGVRYRVVFVEPRLPPPDAYEQDDFDSLGTWIEYGELPLRQYHTFHDEGTGDVDGDWFRIFLAVGDHLTVETSSAQGLWECDTQIDIADAETEYITSNRYKSPDDTYSKLTYTNNTGVDQEFHVYVKPYSHPEIPPNRRVGEYIVEFRPD